MQEEDPVCGIRETCDVIDSDCIQWITRPPVSHFKQPPRPKIVSADVIYYNIVNAEASACFGGGSTRPIRKGRCYLEATTRMGDASVSNGDIGVPRGGAGVFSRKGNIV